MTSEDAARYRDLIIDTVTTYERQAAVLRANDNPSFDPFCRALTKANFYEEEARRLRRQAPELFGAAPEGPAA